ncbi:uncharacterized protein LOC120264857 isoform X4 [Dioscorea cayenensis subsp. rotundata]|uniref:Uncharacterized protein LOC120264857 isoform X4 n=1 Tax=Dioscorea cayennensis subsp. rotundata TaxID=55577 RepID=A0AB40BMQ9_DIOCR|nr:uncharacterized protein LOC120264857 isoform X4 [Dioscorea cayenensis subsp. rotundata]
MLGYFNINGILMEEPMSVVFQVGANGVGLLDPGSEANNLKRVPKLISPFSLLMSYTRGEQRQQMCVLASIKSYY